MTNPDKLAFTFPDQSPNFMNGFTCGRIWQQMLGGRQRIEQLVYPEMRTCIEAMAMAKGWTESFHQAPKGMFIAILINPEPRDDT